MSRKYPPVIWRIRRLSLASDDFSPCSKHEFVAEGAMKAWTSNRLVAVEYQ